MKKFLSGYTKKEWAWILQDWANSVYSLMITAAIFPILAMIFAGPNAWLYLLVVYTLSAIGFSLSNVFYDSSIMDVTT